MLPADSDEEDSESDDDGIPNLIEWTYDGSDSSRDEEEESNPRPRNRVIPRKNRVSAEKNVINNPTAM